MCIFLFVGYLVLLLLCLDCNISTALFLGESVCNCHVDPILFNLRAAETSEFP